MNKIIWIYPTKINLILKVSNFNMQGKEILQQQINNNTQKLISAYFKRGIFGCLTNQYTSIWKNWLKNRVSSLSSFCQKLWAELHGANGFVSVKVWVDLLGMVCLYLTVVIVLKSCLQKSPNRHPRLPASTSCWRANAGILPIIERFLFCRDGTLSIRNFRTATNLL